VLPSRSRRDIGSYFELDMIVFLASTPITIHFFFRDIINLVASQTQVEVLIDKSENPAVFDNLVCELEAGVVDFCIPRKTSAKDVFSLPLFILKTLKRREASTLVSCSPKAALYAALCRFVIGRRIAHIYLIQGSVWYGTVGVKGFIFRQVERFILANSDARLAVSQSEISIRYQSGMISEGEINLINRGAIRGVPPRFFDRHLRAVLRKRYRGELFGESEPKLTVIGYVGRLNDSKGISTILDWYQSEWSADERVGMLFVGPDEMSESLRSRFRAVQREAELLGRSFVYRGFVDDPLPYNASIDFFVLPSQREGFGIAAIEAAAAGAIVIASDVGGLRDAMGNGEGGILISPGRFDLVPRALEDFRRDKLLAETIRSRARNFVKSNFASPSVEINVSNFILTKSR